MFTLTEKDCADLKGEVVDGRMSVAGMRRYLLLILIVSGFFVGISYMIANANTVGWDTLSKGWHKLFYTELVLLVLHALVIILCRGNNRLNQKILSLAVVVCTYRLAFEPYIAVLMFSKDRGTYESYAPIMPVIILCALVFHVIVFRGRVKKRKRDTANLSSSQKLSNPKNKLLFLILFPLVIVSGSVAKNGLLGDFEVVFILLIVVILTFSLMLALSEFIIASYCILRFPSFSVNAPKLKKKQRG